VFTGSRCPRAIAGGAPLIIQRGAKDCGEYRQAAGAAIGPEQMTHKRLTMVGLVALCGLALLVQHVFAADPNTETHLIPGIVMLATAVIVLIAK
jgi:uncharacterized membrane protein